VEADTAYGLLSKLFLFFNTYFAVKKLSQGKILGSEGQVVSEDCPEVENFLSGEIMGYLKEDREMMAYFFE
jgi:hypothetical protein